MNSTISTANSTSKPAAGERVFRSLRKWMHRPGLTVDQAWPDPARISHVYDFDLIYMYHHLREGDEVTIRPALDVHTGNKRSAVFFREYQLGWLAGLSEEKQQRLTLAPQEYSVVVSEIYRQKYLPPRAVSLAIFSKKSGVFSGRK